MANQDKDYKCQTYTETTDPIRYPTPISQVRLLALTQQITTDFQITQEAWNHLNSQMTEMAARKNLLKKATKNNYKNQ